MLNGLKSLGWWQVWVLLFCVVGQAAEQSDASTSSPLYFRQYAVRESRLLELAGDGKYRLLEREHDRVDEVDRGAWDEVSAGQLRLVSWRFSKTIDSPPLKLGWVTTETLSELDRLDSALDHILSHDQSTTIPGGYVDNTLRYALNDTKVRPDIDYERIRIKDPQPISRLEVESFKTAVGAAMTSPIAVTVVAKQREQKEVPYLEIPAVTDYPWVGLQRASVNDAAALEAITTAPAVERIRGLFVQITEEEFRREATSHQEYLFVPQFGADVSSAPAPVKTSDPAVDPVGAIQAFVPSLVELSTSTTEEVAGYYANPGPTMKGGLSGSRLYLFPDSSYFFIEWADIMPGLITSRGIWDVVGDYVLLTDDGTVQGKGRRMDDFAYLPVTYKEKGTTVTGLLGFPESYEWLMDDDVFDSRRLLFRTMERSRDIPVAEAAELKAELMRKHWRPDYAAGKPGAQPPKR